MADAKEDQRHKSEPAEVVPNTGETHVSANLSDEERPPSAQQAQQVPETDPLEPVKDEEIESEEDVDPSDRIEDFDWTDLHERYHDAMTTASTAEQELMQEFAQLMDYFRIWADAGANQESDRTFHRLRTRMSYVQNSEQKLEKTRQHYIEVVRAFESALALLQSAGFGG